jgi:hypothetical protein
MNSFDGTLPQHWCNHCRQVIGNGCTCGLPVPMRNWNEARAPRQRSVVGTTLLVMLTVFVIVPLLLMGGCGLLVGLGSLAGG